MRAVVTMKSRPQTSEITQRFHSRSASRVVGRFAAGPALGAASGLGGSSSGSSPRSSGCPTTSSHTAGARHSAAPPKAAKAPRQPQLARSQAATGTNTMPEDEVPICEMPSAVVRRLANQFTTSADVAMLAIVPDPIAKSVP